MSETSWLTDDQLTFVVGSMLVHEVIFWTYGLVFWLIRKNKWFEEYRLGEEPPSPLVRGLMKEVCLSHFVTQPISLWVLFYVAKASGMKFELEFDSLSSVKLDLLFSPSPDTERSCCCNAVGGLFSLLGPQIAPSASAL